MLVKFNQSFVYYPNIPAGFSIVTDTREQSPYTFSDLGIDNVVRKLDYGDYSIVGMENLITIERKSKGDFYSSITTNRKRFSNVIQNMSMFDWKGLLIEASEDELLLPELSYSGVHTNSVYGSITSFEAKYNIHVYCGSRDNCRMRLINWLIKFYNNKRGII